MLTSGLVWGPVVDGEGTVCRRSWAAPAGYEGVGAEGCGMVDCLASDALELFVARSGDPDSKVFGEEFKTADGFGPTEEFV